MTWRRSRSTTWCRTSICSRCSWSKAGDCPGTRTMAPGPTGPRAGRTSAAGAQPRASGVQGAPAGLKRHDSVDHEAATQMRTNIDQVPGFFVPGPAAVLLLAGAVIWLLRVLGMGAAPPEPAWVYVIVA